MSGEAFVWVPCDEQRVDTIHRAGCAHLNLTAASVALTARTVDEARAEIADAMGWQDYPDDAEGAGFEIDTAPCAEQRRPVGRVR